MTIEDPDSLGWPDAESAQWIFDVYRRNGWQPTVYRDRVITETNFVVAAIILNIPEIEVIQMYDRSTDYDPIG